MGYIGDSSWWLGRLLSGATDVYRNSVQGLSSVSSLVRYVVQTNAACPVSAGQNLYFARSDIIQSDFTQLVAGLYGGLGFPGQPLASHFAKS